MTRGDDVEVLVDELLGARGPASLMTAARGRRAAAAEDAGEGEADDVDLGDAGGHRRPLGIGVNARDEDGQLAVLLVLPVTTRRSRARTPGR